MRYAAQKIPDYANYREVAATLRISEVTAYAVRISEPTRISIAAIHLRTHHQLVLLDTSFERPISSTIRKTLGN